MRRITLGAIAALVFLLGLLTPAAQASSHFLPQYFKTYAGTAVWGWDETGALTVSGGVAINLGTSTVAIGGAVTYTADVTLSGDGIDLLFNAANQNTIGSATKGAKAVYTRAVTGETGTALTLTASSGITVASTSTASGGFIIPPTSEPSMLASTTSGLIWNHNATANYGCGGACATNKFLVFVNGAWAALH